MFPRLLVTLCVFAAIACGPRADTPASTALGVVLHQPQGGQAASVEITGLSAAELAALRGMKSDAALWQPFLTVTVGEAPGGGLPPVQGRYAVTASGVSFTPLFPFDPGRGYLVTFEPSRLPRPRQQPRLSQVVRLPALASNPTTRVTAVYPSGAVLPENTLRMYVEFSAPMGNRNVLTFVRLVNARGDEIENPFLPVQADFWNAEHTRYTLFFDPGRVKQGILPNRLQGRPLEAGQEITLEIAADWHDANAQPLAQPYRKHYRVGRSEDRPLAMSTWRIVPPTAGSQDRLTVTFPAPLDHGLLARALGVEGPGGEVVVGDVVLEADDTRWVFRPRQPWQAGDHQLTALSVLEDPAGNRIGRAFEVDMNKPSSEAPPELFRTGFRVTASGF